MTKMCEIGFEVTGRRSGELKAWYDFLTWEKVPNKSVDVIPLVVAIPLLNRKKLYRLFLSSLFPLHNSILPKFS